jgi:hypothetical protein
MTNEKPTKLMIVLRNRTPNREPQRIAEWVLYGQGGRSVELMIAHDASRGPRILSKRAA